MDSLMATCYALSANLDLSLLEKRQYPVRTTTSGLPTSPSAFVSTVNATVRCKLINCFGNVFPVLVWCYNVSFIMYYLTILIRKILLNLKKGLFLLCPQICFISSSTILKLKLMLREKCVFPSLGCYKK